MNVLGMPFEACSITIIFRLSADAEQKLVYLRAFIVREEQVQTP